MFHKKRIHRNPLKTAKRLSTRKLRGGWRIAAGYPAEAYNYKEDRLDLNKYIIRQKRYNRCIWATHRGLTGGSIVYGDLIVYDESLTPNPKKNPLQVFFIDDEYTLRYVEYYKGFVKLISPNPDVDPLVITDGETLERKGVVTHIIKKFANYRDHIGGCPSDAANYVEHGMDYMKYIMNWWEATFFMWADGDSMLGDYIEKGDLLIVDKKARANISEHDILVFSLNDQFVLKRHKNYGETGALISSNPDYKPIPMATGDEGKVWGVLTVVIKKVL